MQDESGLRSRFGGVGWGATYWDYDVLGRPTRRHDPRGTVVTYGYGPAGHRTELTVEGQGSVYYEHGPTGNMDRLLDGKTGLFTYYEYDPAGRARLQHHPNLPAGSVEGATATYFVYDAAGRLSEKVTKKDSDSSVLVRFAYTRDAAGNPIAIEREPALGAFYYAYDQLQRLAYEGQFVSDERQYENYYEYDAAGNRTLLRHGETDAEDLTYYAYDAANELTQLHDASGWTYFSYDANGNTVMEQTPSYTRYFDWDGRDMLVGVRSTEQAWTDNVYRYDGLASRVSTLESGGLTYYDWDSINVIQEKDGAGEVTDRQVHGHAPIFSVGDIALMDKSGTPYVPVSDQVGTTWNLLDSAAAKANAYAYDAFGVARSASEAVSNLYRFGTKRLGSDLALYHLVARAYVPALARFLAVDRLGLGLGRNGYIYVSNSPSGSVDPAGLWTQILRQWHPRARTCAEVGDASTQGITELANAARMEDQEYAFKTYGGSARQWGGDEGGWLRTEDGQPLTSWADIIIGAVYTVPNTVYINNLVQSGPFQEIAWLWAISEEIELIHEGFNVLRRDATKCDEFKRQLASPDVFGIDWVHHGGWDAPGDVECADLGHTGLRTAKEVLHHKLGCFKLLQCYGGRSNWCEVVAPTGYCLTYRGKLRLGYWHWPAQGCLHPRGGII